MFVFALHKTARSPGCFAGFKLYNCNWLLLLTLLSFGVVGAGLYCIALPLLHAGATLLANGRGKKQVQKGKSLRNVSWRAFVFTQIKATE